jgi:hypothetical protein
MTKEVEVTDENFVLHKTTDVDTVFGVLPGVSNFTSMHVAPAQSLSQRRLDVQRLKMHAVMYGDGSRGVDIHPRQSFNSNVRRQHHEAVVAAVEAMIPSDERANAVVATTPLQRVAFLGTNPDANCDIYICDCIHIFKTWSAELQFAWELMVRWHFAALEEWPTPNGSRLEGHIWRAVGASRDITREDGGIKGPTHESWAQGKPELNNMLLQEWDLRLRQDELYQTFLSCQRRIQVRGR